MLQLRAQHERVENLVDDVVQGYHSGFNKAIHNYSRILDLFSTAQTEVDYTICFLMLAILEVEYVTRTDATPARSCLLLFPCSRALLQDDMFCKMVKLALQRPLSPNLSRC